MKNKFFYTYIFLFLVFCFPAATFADTVCLKSVVNKGKVKNTTKLVAEGVKCPRGHAPIFNTEMLVQLAGLQGGQGAQGFQGPQGPKGDTGPMGLPGSEANVDSKDFIFSFGETIDKSSTNVKTLFVSCPVGTQLLACSGGVEEGLGVPANVPVSLSYSGITRLGNCFFRAFEVSPIDNNWGIFGTAICVPA